MGQNGFIQAEAFNKAIPLSGVVLTKFDNTAKGGIAFSIAQKLKLPIRYVGLGEGAADLELFSPRDFVNALLDMGSANDGDDEYV
jgi:fused signal recognition particle receptor